MIDLAASKFSKATCASLNSLKGNEVFF